MSAPRVPITADDVTVEVLDRQVRVSAPAWSPYRWPAARTVTLIYPGWSAPDAVADYVADVARAGWYLDTMPPPPRVSRY